MRKKKILLKYIIFGIEDASKLLDFFHLVSNEKKNKIIRFLLDKEKINNADLIDFLIQIDDILFLKNNIENFLSNKKIEKIIR